MQPDLQEGDSFIVLINSEDQYSLWPDFLPIPAGWLETGCRGPKQHCLEYVDEHWMDMRPKGLRQKMLRTANES